VVQPPSAVAIAVAVTANWPLPSCQPTASAAVLAVASH